MSPSALWPQETTLEYVSTHRGDQVLVMENNRHFHCQSTGDVPNLEIHECARGLLKNVAKWPLVIEVSARGIGELRLELCNSSRKGLNLRHHKIRCRLDKRQLQGQGGSQASQNANYRDLVEQIVDKPLSDNDLHKVRRQLREFVAEDELAEDIQSLLWLLSVEHSSWCNQLQSGAPQLRAG